jgi:hypothetical protein
LRRRYLRERVRGAAQRLAVQFPPPEDLAGQRFNPRNSEQTRAPYFVNIRLLRKASGEMQPLTGLPAAARHPLSSDHLPAGGQLAQLAHPGVHVDATMSHGRSPFTASAAVTRPEG